MKYYFVNTDGKSNNGISLHDAWFDRGLAITSGPAKYRTKLAGPDVGDKLLLYVNGKGVVGVGQVAGVDVVTTEETVSPNEEIEYHRNVEWDLDLRNSPITARTLKDILGYNPRSVIQCVHKNAELVEKYLNEIYNYRVSPMG